MSNKAKFTDDRQTFMGEIDTFAAMIRELESADPIFLPSGFWRDLNEKNVHMLETEDLISSAPSRKII
jgi:hypothetical protein